MSGGRFPVAGPDTRGRPPGRPADGTRTGWRMVHLHRRHRVRQINFNVKSVACPRPSRPGTHESRGWHTRCFIPTRARPTRIAASKSSPDDIAPDSVSQLVNYYWRLSCVTSFPPDACRSWPAADRDRDRGAHSECVTCGAWGAMASVVELRHGRVRACTVQQVERAKGYVSGPAQRTFSAPCPPRCIAK